MRSTRPYAVGSIAHIDLCAGAAPLRGSYSTRMIFKGPIGFQLSGETTISGESKPVANVGRMALAGDGGISGYSTAMFAGYLLGNPVQRRRYK